MNRKRTISLCMTAGVLIGGYLPLLWGGAGFSMTAILLSGVGGALGIWLGFQLSR